MKKAILLSFFGLWQLAVSAQTRFGNDYSIRPVGARALGMGGAFTALVNDATAASWNPGALGLLKGISVSGGGWVQQTWGTLDGEAYDLFDTGEISENPLRFGLNHISVAVPFVIDKSEKIVITPAISYNEWGNYKGIQQKWDLTYSDGTNTASESFNFNNNGGINSVIGAFGVSINNKLSVGLAYNTLSGSRKNQVNRTLPNGTTTESLTESTFKGNTLNFGMKYSTGDRDSSATSSSYGNGFDFGLNVTVPSQRYNIQKTGDNTTTNYLLEPARIRGGIAFLSETVAISVDGSYADYSKTNNVLQETKINQVLGKGMNATSVSAGMEIDQVFRFGGTARNYLYRDPETEKQVWTYSANGGVTFGSADGKFNVDLGAQFEFFNWKNTLTYNNGQGIAYKGTVFTLFATARVLLPHSKE